MKVLLFQDELHTGKGKQVSLFLKVFLKVFIKKYVPLLLIFSLLLSVFTACGNRNNATGNNRNEIKAQTKIIEGEGINKEQAGEQDGEHAKQQIKKEQEVNLKLWCFPNYGEGKFHKMLMVKFQEVNPEVKFELEVLPFNGGPEKVNIAISTNTAPDILFDAPVRIMSHAKKNVLIALDDVVLTKEDMDNIDPKILKLYLYKGRYYYYPWNNYGIGIAVNKSLFEKAGALDLLPLNREERDWTIEEFEKALDAVSKIYGVYGTAFPTANEQGDAAIIMFIQNFGANILSGDYKEVVLNSKNGYEGIKWMVDIYRNKKGWVVPGSEFLTSTDQNDLFFKKKVAMIYGFKWHYVQLQELKNKGQIEEPFEIVFMPYPHPAGMKTRSNVVSNGFCLFDNRDQTKIKYAIKFANFIKNDFQVEGANIAGGFPVNNSLKTDLSDKELQFLSDLRKYIADDCTSAPNWTRVRTVWYPELQAAFTGAKTARQALDAFVEKAQKILDEASK